VILQLVLFLVFLWSLAWPLGLYMARVYEGRGYALDRALGWLECFIYRVSGIRADQEMAWTTMPARCCCSTSRASLPFWQAGVDMVFQF